MGFEPMMRVLQTLALPLGHVSYSRLVGVGLFSSFFTLFFIIDSYHELRLVMVMGSFPQSLHILPIPTER